MKYFTRTLLISLTLPTVALAQDTAPTQPTFASMLSASGITVTGFIDTTYNALSTSGRYVNGINSRVFDAERNSFLLNAANLTVSSLPSEGFGGLVDVTAGTNSDIIASYGTIDRTRGPGAGEDQFFDVTQAFAQYATGPFTVIAGKFNTLAGAEVIKAPFNTNITRSILFGYAIPFTHTGLRASYKVSDLLTLIGGINNGWDTVRDTNTEKTLELGMAYTPSKMVSLAVQGYAGEEQIFNYPVISPDSGFRYVIDAVLTVNATDRLSFVLNGDYGMQEDAILSDDAEWYGIAGYANYQFTDQWRTSLRAEYFNDKDGYRTAIAPGETSGQEQKEITLTVAYIPVKNAELRAELRRDFSDQDVFLEADGGTSDSQDSINLEAIYKF
jgi:hypothetical protein